MKKYIKRPVMGTSKKQLYDRKQALFDKATARNDELGNSRGQSSRVIFNDEERIEYSKLELIGMLHSIFTYEDYTTVPEIMQDRYIAKYINELGYDTVEEIVQQEFDYFNEHATVSHNTFVDYEGLPYNSVRWDDEV